MDDNFWVHPTTVLTTKVVAAKQSKVSKEVAQIVIGSRETAQQTETGQAPGRRIVVAPYPHASQLEEALDS